MRKTFLLLTVLSLLGTFALAAGERAAINGTVSDKTGAVIPGVTIRAINIATNQTMETISNDSGFYAFPSLLLGAYTVEAELEGFQKFKQTGMNLQVGANVRLNIILEVGNLAEVITVEANVDLVTTTDATLGQVINDQIIERMPLNGRNFVQLARLSPGVNGGTQGYFDGTTGDAETMRYYWAGNAAISANGVRENQNNYLLDGVDNNESFVGTISIFPNLDAIAEFSVETTNASAEFGRAGGAVVNATLKSGSNDFHGTAFWFVRNEAFDANSWENNKNGREKTPLRQNQFGYTLGGPIIKDKTFFFTDYQGLRLRIPQTTEVSVPTVAQRSASYYTGTVDPTAINYFNAFPLPNVAGTDNRYYAAEKARHTTSDQFNVRIDHNFSESDTLFGRFSYARDYTQLDSTFPDPLYAGWAAGKNLGNTRGLAFGETHIFSPSVANEFRLGFHRVHLGWFPTNYQQNSAEEIGIPGVNFDDLTSGMPLIHVEGIEWVGDYGPYTLPENTYTFTDNISWINGNHSFKFGVNINRRQQNYFQQDWGKGFYEFGNVNDCATAWAYHVAKGALHGTVGMRSWEYGFFIQDDWKVSERLTLNLGLRWDIFPSQSEVADRMANFDPATQTMILADGGGMVDTEWNNFGPRVGFAYALTGDNKTVLRGGYGIYYSVENGGLGTSLASAYPFNNVANDYTWGLYNLSVAIPYPPDADPTEPRGQLKWRDPQSATPYVQQWNLTGERELVTDLLLSVSYVGTRGTKLGAVRNINMPPLEDGVVGPRPYDEISDNIMAYEFRANSYYHALQTKIDKRFSNSFAILAAYTWSHSIDDSPGAFAGNGNGGLAAEPQDVYNLAAERANAGYDLRHRFSASWIWDLPFGQGRAYGSDIPTWANMIIGGWQLNGVWTWQSGAWMSVNVWNRQGSLPIHWGSTRPDRIGDGNFDYGERTPDHWFDYAAFDDKLNEPVHYGNAGRNIINGPRYNSIDFSLFKDFKIYEEQKVEFRWEVFNLFNHSQFNFPESSVNSESWNGNIGKISSTRNASWRIMQFSLKYIF